MVPPWAWTVMPLAMVTLPREEMPIALVPSMPPDASRSAFTVVVPAASSPMSPPSPWPSTVSTAPTVTVPPSDAIAMLPPLHSGGPPVDSIRPSIVTFPGALS